MVATFLLVAFALLSLSSLCSLGEAVTVPAAPARVNLDVRSGDEVAVSFSAPLDDGGSAVQSYEVSTRKATYLRRFDQARVASVKPLSSSCQDTRRSYFYCCRGIPCR